MDAAVCKEPLNILGQFAGNLNKGVLRDYTLHTWDGEDIVQTTILNIRSWSNPVWYAKQRVTRSSRVGRANFLEDENVKEGFREEDSSSLSA